jgi:Fe2+ or Zn2+ uptake regulation protein
MTSRRVKVLELIKEHTEERGAPYFKSRDLAKRSELNAKQIGTEVGKLEDEGFVSRFACSKGHRTWKVEQ